MRTIHKALILVCAISIVHSVILYFLGAEINGWALLAAALVIVHNLRELQFENTKDLLFDARHHFDVIMDAIHKEFGDEGMLRVWNRGLDILAENAPDDIREEALKTVEAIKKLNK